MRNSSKDNKQTGAIVLMLLGYIQSITILPYILSCMLMCTPLLEL
jgi:hypothetical protein